MSMGMKGHLLLIMNHQLPSMRHQSLSMLTRINPRGNLPTTETVCSREFNKR